MQPTSTIPSITPRAPYPAGATLTIILIACTGQMGCAPESPTPAATSLTESASADRLHNMCNALLLFYARYARLPNRLESLSRFGGPPPNVPLTNEPYVYVNPPIKLPERKSDLLVHEPIADNQPGDHPVWCVLVRTPGGGSLATQVIALPTKDVREAGAKANP